MRQHIVAQFLRIAQTGAMAQHDPGVGANDGDMVGNSARVAGAYADIDQRDAVAIGRDKMIGRHLRQAGGAFATRRLRIEIGIVRGVTAGFHQRRIALPIGRQSRIVRARHNFLPHPQELIDVKLIVREDDEVLEMPRIAARIMTQAVQRIIDARRGKQSHRGISFAGRDDTDRCHWLCCHPLPTRSGRSKVMARIFATRAIGSSPPSTCIPSLKAK